MNEGGTLPLPQADTLGVLVPNSLGERVNVMVPVREGVLEELTLGLRVELPKEDWVREADGEIVPDNKLGVLQGEEERVALWEGLGDRVVEGEEERQGEGEKEGAAVGEPVVHSEPIVVEDALPQALADTLGLGLRVLLVVVVAHTVPLGVSVGPTVADWVGETWKDAETEGVEVGLCASVSVGEAL